MSEKVSPPLTKTLETAQKLCSSKGASVAELERVISSLPGAIEAAESGQTALKGRRREMLLSGSDSDLLKLDAETAAADRLHDRLRAVADELDARLAHARENQHREEVDRLRQEALAAAALAEGLYEKTYLQAGACLLVVIKSFAEADAARERYSRASGDKSLSTPETVLRNRPAMARKVVHTEIVELFVLEGETQPASEMVQEHIQATGMAPPARQAEIRSGSPVYVRRKFRKNVVAQPVSAIFAGSLAREIVLPPLRAGERHLWHGESDGRERSTIVAAVDAALERIARLETGESNARPAPETIEYELLPDADSAATARAIEETRRAAQ
jgi:hypothetical protein